MAEDKCAEIVDKCTSICFAINGSFKTSDADGLFAGSFSKILEAEKKFYNSKMKKIDHLQHTLE